MREERRSISFSNGQLVSYDANKYNMTRKRYIYQGILKIDSI